MKSNPATTEVLNWIANGCDYASGAEIYSRIGKIIFLRQQFPGKEHKYKGKLMYELCKSAGLDINQVIGDNPVCSPADPVINPSPKDLKPIQIKRAQLPPPELMPEAFTEKNQSEYPPIIRRVISEYTEKFQERSKIHLLMCELPESNARSVKTKRAELFSMVKDLSNRLELLYQVREEYTKTGNVPLNSVVFPTPASQPEPTLPDTIEELKKMKKNLQSSNSKDQNKLDYQSLKQAESKNPMPAGTKRQKLENHIKARTKLIKEIDCKIISFDAVQNF